MAASATMSIEESGAARRVRAAASCDARRTRARPGRRTAGSATSKSGTGRAVDNRCMAKEKSVYSCTECGATSPKWLGKCPGCGAWNTLVESVAEPAAPPRYATAGRGLLPAEAVATLAEIDATDAERHPTGIDEFDRALGGGIVAGGV